MKKVLVVYFSVSGVTERVAEDLAKEFNADLEEIVPAKRYTSADLNWMDKNSRSSLEMKDENSRPEILKGKFDITNYDVVMIGYP
ncbi:MAG: flavodoxin, partial [Firmicutes bacterium]|nr:flavodoxin [Candidatus Alectryobacillus merdavium]